MPDNPYVSKNLNIHKFQYEKALHVLLNEEEVVNGIFGCSIVNCSGIKGRELSPGQLGTHLELNLQSLLFGPPRPLPDLFILTDKYLHLIQKDWSKKKYIWYRFQYQDILEFVTNFIEKSLKSDNTDRLVIFFKSRNNPFIIDYPSDEKAKFPFGKFITIFSESQPSLFNQVFTEMGSKYGNNENPEKLAKKIIKKDLLFKSLIWNSQEIKSANGGRKDFPAFLFSSSQNNLYIVFFSDRTELSLKLLPEDYLLLAMLFGKKNAVTWAEIFGVRISEEAVIEKISKMSSINEIKLLPGMGCLKNLIFNIHIVKNSSSHGGSLRIEWVDFHGITKPLGIEMSYTTEETFNEIVSFFEDCDQSIVKIS